MVTLHRTLDQHIEDYRARCVRLQNDLDVAMAHLKGLEEERDRLAAIERENRGFLKYGSGNGCMTAGCRHARQPGRDYCAGCLSERINQQKREHAHG